MCSAVSSTDGEGVLIFFLITAQNINAGESHGGSHTWLFSQHFILCSDVNIMKLSLVMLVKPRVTLLQTLQRII